MNINKSKGRYDYQNNETLADSSQIQLDIVRSKQCTTLSKSPTLQRIQQVPPECRLCLQAITQENADIDLQCQCKGANRVIHKQCFLAWGQKKLKRDNIKNQFYTECDVCKSRIGLQVQRQCRLLTCKEISRTLFKKQLSCTLMMLGLMLGSVIIIIIAASLFGPKEHITGLQQAIMILGIVTPTVIFASVIAYAIYFFAIEKKKTVIDVKDKNKIFVEQQRINKRIEQLKVQANQLQIQDLD